MQMVSKQIPIFHARIDGKTIRNVAELVKNYSHLFAEFEESSERSELTLVKDGQYFAIGLPYARIIPMEDESVNFGLNLIPDFSLSDGHFSVEANWQFRGYDGQTGTYVFENVDYKPTNKTANLFNEENTADVPKK